MPRAHRHFLPGHICMWITLKMHWVFLIHIQHTIEENGSCALRKPLTLYT